MGAAFVAVAALAIGLAGAAGCSNVIGLNKDYVEEETSCQDALRPATNKQYCPDFMKAVPGPFCIDLNEVTWGQYEAVAATNPAQHPGCGTNDMKPGGDRPAVQGDAGTDDYPVTFVDWCDAWAYCNALGKRLCGDIVTGEGQSIDDSSRSCTEDEWYSACSAGGRYQYAEGAGDSKRQCNVPGVSTDNKPLPVGSMQECTTGHADYLKIMDMNGNVAEWVNQCTFKADTQAPNDCKVRGGAYGGNLDGSDDCFGEHTLTATSKNSYVGFRCCATIKTAQ